MNRKAYSPTLGIKVLIDTDGHGTNIQLRISPYYRQRSMSQLVSDADMALRRVGITLDEASIEDLLEQQFEGISKGQAR